MQSLWCNFCKAFRTSWSCSVKNTEKITPNGEHSLYQFKDNCIFIYLRERTRTLSWPVGDSSSSSSYEVFKVIA